MDKTGKLVAQLQAKNVDAFEQLHKMYAKNIIGAINIIVNDEIIAEEICQDVFLKVWEKSNLYDSKKGRFFTWLLNMARNAAIDHTRSKQYKEQKMNQSIDFFVDIFEKPDDTEADKDSYRGLKHLLKQLKKKCVVLIEMLYFKNYSQAMAAEHLNIPVGTVKSRNRNCLNELRKHIPNEY